MLQAAKSTCASKERIFTSPLCEGHICQGHSKEKHLKNITESLLINIYRFSIAVADILTTVFLLALPKTKTLKLFTVVSILVFRMRTFFSFLHSSVHFTNTVTAYII